MYRRIYVLELFTVMYIGGMTDKAGLALDANLMFCLQVRDVRLRLALLQFALPRDLNVRSHERG